MMNSSADFLSMIHSGETLFVLGNSYSLEEQDLILLLDRTTIGVNRILRHSLAQNPKQRLSPNLPPCLPFPTYLLIVDASVVKQELPRILNYEGQMVAFQGVKGLLQKNGVGFLEFGLMPRTGWKKSGPMEISCNTAIYAVQLARRMGAAKIVLLGIDLTGYERKVSHFFGDGKKEGCRLTPGNVKKVLDELGTFVVLCKEEGVEVVNASPCRGPMDTVMPYLPLKEILRNA